MAQDLTIEIGASTGQAESALDELVGLMRELVGHTSRASADVRGLGGALGQIPVEPMEQVTASAKTQTSAVQLLRDNWRALATVVAGLGLGSLFGDVADQARDLRTLSLSLGVTTRGLQTFDFAAEQAGVSVSAARGALQALQDQMTSAALGEQGAMTNLGFLGLSRSELQSMDAAERFSEVAEALARIEDPARRTVVAMRVFGGGAKELGPLLAKTPDELRELARWFVELGGGLSGEQIEAMAQWDTQMSRVRVTITTMRALLAQTLLPVLRAVAAAIGGVVKWLADMQRSFKVLEVGGIAAVLAGFLKLLPMLRTLGAIDIFRGALGLAKWLAIGAVIAAVAAVIQDIIHMFRGGRSAIAEWIDAWAGLGRVDGWVRNIKAGWEAMSKLEFPGIQDMLDSIKQLTVIPELDAKIEATQEAIQRMRVGIADGSLDPTKASMALAAYNATLRQLQEERFGARGLRAVGRGLMSDVQRSGEMTTGSLSRFEGGAGSVTVQNEIKVEAGAGTREIADGARRGVEQANRETARQLQQAVGGKR